MNEHEAQYNVFAAVQEEFPDSDKVRSVAAFDAAWKAVDEQALVVGGKSEQSKAAELKRINRQVRAEVLELHPVGFFNPILWIQVIRMVAFVVKLVWDAKHKKD